MKNKLKYFTLNELLLWIISIAIIIVSFIIFDRSNYLTLFASLIGVSSLIFNAKGNPIGQILMIIFSLLYGYISFTFAYYGEMVTYLGMTLPMSLIAFISWIKNPYKGNKAEVKVNHLSKKNIIIMITSTIIVTVLFYFVLKAFKTPNIIPSTLSIATSYIAAFLTFKRSELFAIGYLCNDIILIVLWILAFIQDISYFSVIICFIVFFANDLYGFINWRRMSQKQANN